MADKLDPNSRGILNFRPDLSYDSPDVENVDAKPVGRLIPVSENINEFFTARNLAKSVDTLASAIQARADQKAVGFIIKLDPKVDASAVQSMRRLYPDANPLEITYEQYQSCKENQLAHGESIAEKNAMNLDAAMDQLSGGGADPLYDTSLSGLISDDAMKGNLRPEVNADNHLVDPIDVDEFSADLLEILVDSMWSKFFKPKLPIPGLPDSITGA